MVLKNKGEVFQYAGTKYVVGDKVIATKGSIYEGLIGVITKIKTGRKNKTGDNIPDIYCTFAEPVLKVNKKILMKRFFGAIKNVKKMKYINLTNIMMKPDGIVPVSEYGKCKNKKTIFLLVENFGEDGDVNISIKTFTERKSARQQMEIELNTRKEDGMLDVDVSDGYVVMQDVDSYECYREGFYSEWHYSIYVCEQELNLSEDFVKDVGQRYVKQIFADDFEAQVEDWDELADFSDEEYEAFVNNPEIPNRICEELRSDENFMTEYISAISEIAHRIVDEAVKKRMGAKK